jgi:nitric oxide reductase NorQ protein
MSYEINKPTIWFLTTINETNDSGVPRIRLLPNQMIPDPDGSGSFIPGDVTYNIQTDFPPRQNNPIGSIFCVQFIEKKVSTRGTPYYNAKREKRIELTCLNGGVTAEIQDAYNEYVKQSSFATSMAALEEKTPKPTGVSLIDKLLKENPIPTVDKDNFYVEKEVWAQLLFNITKGYNTMLMGDSGTGKTELSILVGDRLKKPVKVFDMAAKQDPIASLIGVHRFDGKSVFDRADFTYAIEESGIVVLDELPRAPLNTNNILFPILDSRRTLNMDVAAHGLRAIKVNPECAFIATANEGYEYTGNNVLDRALKERFEIVRVHYMPEKQEIDLLVNRTGVDKMFAEVIVKVGRQIRDMHKREDITNGVSVRHTLYAADLTAGGFGVSKAMEASFVPMFHLEDEKKKIKDLLTSR